MRNATGWRMLLAGVVLLPCLAAGAEQGATELVDAWRAQADDASDAEARTFAKEILAAAEHGDSAVIEKLLVIVAREEASLFSRRRALATACELDDGGSSSAILEVVERRLAAYRAVGKSLNNVPRRDPRVQVHINDRWLLKEFSVCCAERLLERTELRERVLQLLVDMGLSEDGDMPDRKRYRLILESCPDAATRQERIVELMRPTPTGFVPPVLLKELTPDACPAFREMVRSHPGDVPHSVAVHVLAHFGDAEILPYLEEVWQESLQDRPWIANNLDVPIQMIKIQNPPEQLLPLIENIDEPVLAVGPSWLIERASATLPREDVRKALMKYLEGYRGKHAIGGMAEGAIVGGLDAGIISGADIRAFEIRVAPRVSDTMRE